MANSRALVRRDTLLAPRLSGWVWFGAGGAQVASPRVVSRQVASPQVSRKMSHFDGCETRFKPLVAALETGTVDGLLEGVTSQHAKNNRQAGIHLRELQAARGFRADIIVMRSFAAKNAADSDERVIAARCGKLLGGQRQFERARHVNDVDALVVCACAVQRIQCGGEQAFGDEAIEAADHEAETQSGGGEFAMDSIGLRFIGHIRGDGGHLPLNCAARFSRKALVPSRISSVAQERPKRVASRKSPSSWGISTPRSMASMAYFTASGALAMIFLAMASAAGKSSAGS